MFTEIGKFSRAAKLEKDIGELYEGLGYPDDAIKHFAEAAEYFEGEGSSASASQCKLKVADHYAMTDKYDEAIELFEELASSSLGNDLTRWVIRDYLFKAGLCHLCLSV